MNMSRPSNLEMVMNDTVMNQAEEAASIEQSAWCRNGAETNTRVQNHAMEIQHFHVTNQPHQSNFLHTQSNQAGQMNPLLSASTGLMHHLLNNSLRLPSEARISSTQPYMSQLNGYHAPDNTDGVGLLNHHHATEPLVNQTCPIETQIVQSLLSQPNQIDEQMSFQSNQRQTQTHGSQRTPAAIRSKRNRDKNKEMMDTLKNEKEKATENERGLTEENEKLTAEKTMLMNEIGKLKAEKMEWKKEKQVLTANMTANTESIRKLAAQYEALSQSKQWIQDLEGFRHSNEQILKQNRGSNIKRRIVLQLDVSDGKDKQKAMEVVSVLSGIDSISIDMKDKKLTVIGDVDPINVVTKLRNQWYTEILTVVPVKEEEKKDTKKDEKKKESDQIAELVKAYRAYNPYTTMHYHPVRALENPNSCVIC